MLSFCYVSILLGKTACLFVSLHIDKQTLRKTIKWKKGRNGLIDIHTHILPGFDDGAKTEEDSLEMARAAVAEGITTVVATPHHRNGVFDNERESIEKWVDILNELLEKENVPLTVLPGQETRINGEMIEELENGTILPINHSRHVFVELPFSSVPRYTGQMLFDIQLQGYIPIIVHPERNQELVERPEKLYDFVKKGALTQLTTGSLIGEFGKDAQKFSRQIIEANLVHFVATDAHNTTTRRFNLSEAYNIIQKDFGSDYFYMYLENAELMANDQNVNRPEPMQVKRKRFFGLL